MSDQWRYVTLLIKSQGNREDNWYITQNDGTRLKGLDSILNTYRERGWELIQLTPERFSHSLLFIFSSQVQTMYAVFKRPLE